MIEAKEIRILIPVPDAYATSNEQLKELMQPRVVEAYMRKLNMDKCIPFRDLPDFIEFSEEPLADPVSGDILYDPVAQNGRVAIYRGFGYFSGVEDDLEPFSSVLARAIWNLDE